MISREKAEHYTWGQDCDGWHLLKSDELSVIYERMPPGTSEIPHFHRNSRQFFFVLSGEATIEIAGKREPLSTHEGAEVPSGVPHQMFNESKHDVEFLVISQPPSHGDRVNCWGFGG
jgi:mannose-6-phosphate isomerase-like protein (cupin superfamily)